MRAAFSRAVLKPASPFVRTPFRAELFRLAGPALCALERLTRKRFRGHSVVGFTLQRLSRCAGSLGRNPLRRHAVTFGGIAPDLFPGFAETVPSREAAVRYRALAFESPMAMGLLCGTGARACPPLFTCSISSRTNSPACVDGDLPSHARPLAPAQKLLSQAFPTSEIRAAIEIPERTVPQRVPSTLWLAAYKVQSTHCADEGFCAVESKWLRVVFEQLVLAAHRGFGLARVLQRRYLLRTQCLEVLYHFQRMFQIFHRLHAMDHD